MKEMRRVLALVLCFVMLVGYVPVGALAAEADATAPVETQAVEEVVEAVLGEAVSVSVEKSDSEPAKTETEAPAEETEVVEEIVEAVIGPVISASKSEPEETEPATTEAVEETEAAVETYPAETEAEEAELLEEESAYEEAVLAAVDDDALTAALEEAKAYIDGITVDNSGNDPATVVKNFGTHFTWDNEKRESGKDYLYDWSYYNGVVFEGLEYLYEVTGDEKYRDYVVEYMSSLIAEDGSWAVTSNNAEKTAAGYVDYHGADCYKTASLLLDAYEMTGDVRYLDMAETLYADLDAAAESYSLANAGNNYRHTWASDPSPDLWLDGLYMILPFRAEYAARIGDAAELDLIVDRLQWVSDNMYNDDNGLFYHAANNATDNSETHWLRSMGWYAAAMADVMDSLEGDNLKAVQAQLKKMVDGLAAHQESNGMWLNDVTSDAPGSKNPYEPSGTALVAYAIMKAVNNEWLDDSYAQLAINAFVGICDVKLNDGVLEDVCLKGAPGSTSAQFVPNEGKGVGPLIMLYAELNEHLNGAVELEPVLESIVASGRETFDQREAFEEPVVTACFTDYSSVEVTDFELTGSFDMDVPGTYTVTVTYGGKSAEYTFTVVEKAPVLVEGVTAEVEDVTEDIVVMDALVEIGIVDNYVAYDIASELAEGETAEVSVPVPEEWADKELTAYYIDDEGNVSDETFEVTYVDGYAVFTVSHFSTYVVGLAGQETKVELNGNTLDVDNYTVVRYEPKEVYVRVNSISGAGDYLIVDRNAAGTGNILTATTNGVTNATSEVKSGYTDGSTTAINYIESPNAASVWTVTATSSGYHLYNTNQSRFLYLNRTGNSNNRVYTLTTSTTAQRWTSTTNRLRNASYTDYYLRYNSGWTVIDDNDYDVYFYQKQTVALRTEYDRSGVYSIEGNPVSMVVKTDGTSTAQLTGTLTFAPNDSKLTSDDTNISTTATYATVFHNYTTETDMNGDPDGIISKIEGNTITFSGKYGSAVVEMTYAQKVGDQTYYLGNYIQVTAQAPYYSIEILDGTGSEVDKISYRLPADMEDAQGIPVKYRVTHTYYNAAGELVTEEITPESGTIKWEVDNEDVAVVESGETSGHFVWFNAEGKTKLTVYYEYEDGKSVIDVIDLIGTMRDYVVPEDETADFPEYPNEGAVRIDKTAKAVGTFSQTGVAQVELSMAGVPFSSGNEIDVVIMVDMSGSMADNNRVPAAKEATIAAIEALVKNEDGSFNDNRVAVYTFSTNLNPNDNAYFDLDTFDQTRLDAMVKAEINAWSKNGGTDYGDALSKCQTVLATARTDGIGDNREQFVIFVTDGAPTYNTTFYTNTATGATKYYQGDGDEYTSVIKEQAGYTEKYSYDMRKEGIKVYSVGIEIDDTSDKATILKKIGGTQDEKGNVVTAYDSNYANYALFPEKASELTDAFMKIVGQIKQAATNIVVDDLVAPEFSLILNTPSGVTLPTGTELCMEVVEYTLDENKNRVEPATVIEKVSASDTSKVTLDAAGNVVKINADNFTYEIYVEDGEEKQRLIWKTDKLEKKELAIRYYVYLNDSAGVKPEDAVEAGAYQTNVEATITYTNYLGNTCQQIFPIPQLTWNGAQVTYQFYLVNEDGDPVNRAGRVIPFAEAIYVTNPVTKAVTWNAEKGVTSLSADYLAYDLLPGVYTLYDPDAYYEIRVYQTEGVDGPIAGKNYNYFTIDGGVGVSNKTTTKVFNSKSGTICSDYGIYSQQNVGTVLATTTTNDKGETVDTTVTTTKKVTDLDYSSTIVNFAVMWTPALEPDTVVIDYGLDVELNIATNDVMDSVLVGVMNSKPKAGVDTVVMGSGTYVNPVGTQETAVFIDGTEVGVGKVLSQESVGFSLNKGNGMLLNKPAVFYYETETTYWTYDTQDPNDKGTKHTEYMYSSVTVIPATTVYYEDEYVTLKTYVNDQPVSGWDRNSVKASGKQATDRPGVYKNMEDEKTFDANNVYGYDGAYGSCSTYSMDNSAMVHVNNDRYATAEFDFYGTGFDVISMTSNRTGTLVVQAFPYNADGSLSATPKKSIAVDTYYGYDYGMYYVTYLYAVDYTTVDGKTVQDCNWRMIDASANGTATKTELPDYSGLELADKKKHVGEEVTLHQMYWMQIDSDKYQLYTYTDGEWVAGEIFNEDPDTEYGPQSNLDEITDFDGNSVTTFTEGDTISLVVSSALYQVPVMKIDGLTYGKYHAVITAAYSEWLDHTMYDGYDLYLDAIRIYDPAGNTYDVGSGDTKVEGNIDDVIQDAYLKDNEAWPVYNELRNLLITAQSFGDTDSTDGTVFIDQKAYGYTVADYTSYGPNNELYLAPNQAVSFTLDPTVYGSAAKDVQIGMKSANASTVKVKLITSVDAKGTTAEIPSSTDRYYSIAKHVNRDSATTITIQNVGDEGTVVSITNIKMTYGQQPVQSGKDTGAVTVNKEETNAVLKMLNAVEAPVEPEVELNADLDVNIRKTSVKVGNTVVVKATTSADVASLTVNGTEVTKYSENRQTGKRSWTATVKAEEAGDLNVEVIAYSADGQELATATKTVEVTASKASIAQKTIESIISKLFR